MNNKMKWGLVLATILVVALVSFLISRSSPATQSVNLYFYNSALDQGPGGAQCGRSGIVAVTRETASSRASIEDAVNLLLRGGLTDAEREQGLSTEFPLAGVELESVIVEDGVATLTFRDPYNKTSGGACRASVLWLQIEETVKQFPNVAVVRFSPEYLFQP